VSSCGPLSRIEGGVRRGPGRCRWALLGVAVLDSRKGYGCRGQEKSVVLLGARGDVGSSCIAGAVRRHLEVEFTHNIARMGPCWEMWHSGLPPTPLVAAGRTTCHVSDRWVGWLPRTTPAAQRGRPWGGSLRQAARIIFASSSNQTTNITMSANNEPFYIRY
jgi:hypothetical protein